MRRPLVRAEERRQRHGARGVGVEQRLRHGERRMRAHVRDEERPRPVALRRAALQPVDREPRDLAVVLLVVALARVRLLEVETPLAGVHRLLVRPAEQHAHAALAVQDVHRRELFAEAVVVVARAEVELADRHHVGARVAEPMHPAPAPAVVHDRVVPVTGLEREAAGRDRRARRAAERARGVRVRPARAGGRDAVDRRRADDRIAVAAGRAAGVIVREEEEPVRRAGHPGA